jgi:hypothetical protein
MASIEPLLDAANAYVNASPEDKGGAIDDVLRKSKELRDARTTSGPPQVSAGAGTEALVTDVQSAATELDHEPVNLDHSATTANLLTTLAANQITQGGPPHVDDLNVHHTISATRDAHADTAAAPVGLWHHLVQDAEHGLKWLIKTADLDADQTLIGSDPDKLRAEIDTALNELPQSGVAVVKGSIPVLGANLGALFTAPERVIAAALDETRGEATKAEQLVREAALHLLTDFGVSADQSGTIVTKLQTALGNKATTIVSGAETKLFGDVIGTRLAVRRVDTALGKPPSDAVAKQIAGEVNKSIKIYVVGTAALVKLLKGLTAIGTALAFVPGANVVGEAAVAGTGLLAVAATLLGGMVEDSVGPFERVRAGVPVIVESGRGPVNTSSSTSL